MTDELEQLLWTLNLQNAIKNSRKNRNGIQKQIEQRKEKIADFFNSTRKHKPE